ncbi:lysylphosphatidylglycerol synthase domain-containing protein [Pleurocapsa sp. PCC 7319]|uniref:lysylphosphatidylglycerol synthase domain-containing protein n=1 Tax=Pleurocapsa sp. PCC 7319 TaxID=118161 RepID=UPI00034B179A|nr:lysylphosphatidylglycerol synthase domain-containing protein [Pleurocapsa sp. PCC 7319]
MKQILAQIKPYLRWFILGGTLFFLIKTIKDRFAEVAAIRVNAQGCLLLLVALIVTIAAHVWSGWVWTWIVAIFKQPLGVKEGIRVYLVTNIAKYSPGNIWHFYGRIAAVARKGGSRGAATLSVLLEPLLMAAAALLIALVSSGLGWLETDFDYRIVLLQIISLTIVLFGIQPRILNPLLHRLSLSKNKADSTAAQAIELQKYPIFPFLGEIGFVFFRGMGFIFTFMALQSVTWSQIPQLISAFSFAWLFGLVVPGAPGGLGVFEVTAYSLLDNAQFPAQIVAVGCYRLISVLAEAIAAGICFQRGRMKDKS